MAKSSYEINRELKKWEERVIFPNGFKPNTKANLDRLNEILDLSLEHFIQLNANSEALVYKIGKYFITQGVRDSDLVFASGKIIESYIGDDSADWAKKQRADDYFDVFGGQFNNKWVLIPRMDFSIDAGLAIYFMSLFKKFKAIGVIFYAEGSENIAQVLNYQSDYEYLLEFPKSVYRKRRTIVQDDEW